MNGFPSIKKVSVRRCWSNLVSTAVSGPVSLDIRQKKKKKKIPSFFVLSFLSPLIFFFLGGGDYFSSVIYFRGKFTGPVIRPFKVDSIQPGCFHIKRIALIMKTIKLRNIMLQSSKNGMFFYDCEIISIDKSRQ